MNKVCSCSFKVCSDWLSWSSEKGHDEGFGQAYRRFSRLLADAAQVRADAKEIPDLKAAEDGVGNRRKRQVGFSKARSRILDSKHPVKIIKIFRRQNDVRDSNSNIQISYIFLAKIFVNPAVLKSYPKSHDVLTSLSYKV